MSQVLPLPLPLLSYKDSPTLIGRRKIERILFYGIVNLLNVLLNLFCAASLKLPYSCVEDRFVNKEETWSI